MLPIASDQDSRRFPAATAAIVVATAVAYLAMRSAIGAAGPGDGAAEAAADWVGRWGLSRGAFRAWQPVTYLFVHDPASVWHLAGNMLFLWTFGAAVEGRLGRWGFVAFYLAGGAIAGLVQIAVGGGPVIGASGAVSAATGAFIALYPRARVAVFLFLSVVPMPAMLLVGLYFLLDLLGAFGLGRGGIGYAAHLAGAVYGLATACVLLGTGLVRRTDMDLLLLARQWRRRREMRAALEGDGTAGGPWMPPHGAAPGGTVRAGEGDAPAELGPRARERLAARLQQSAGEAFARGDWDAAAAGLERAIAEAPEAPSADEARLMLAVIHLRKRPDRERGAAELRRIGPRLPERLRPLMEELRAEAGIPAGNAG